MEKTGSTRNLHVGGLERSAARNEPSTEEKQICEMPWDDSGAGDLRTAQDECEEAVKVERIAMDHWTTLVNRYEALPPPKTGASRHLKVELGEQVERAAADADTAAKTVKLKHEALIQKRNAFDEAASVITSTPPDFDKKASESARSPTARAARDPTTFSAIFRTPLVDATGKINTQALADPRIREKGLVPQLEEIARVTQKLHSVKAQTTQGRSLLDKNPTDAQQAQVQRELHALDVRQGALKHSIRHSQEQFVKMFNGELPVGPLKIPPYQQKPGEPPQQLIAADKSVVSDFVESVVDNMGPFVFGAVLGIGVDAMTGAPVFERGPSRLLIASTVTSFSALAGHFRRLPRAPWTAQRNAFPIALAILTYGVLLTDLYQERYQFR